MFAIMPKLLTTTKHKKIGVNMSHSVLILVNPHPPSYLTMDQFIFHCLIYLFDLCVGIGSVVIFDWQEFRACCGSKAVTGCTAQRRWQFSGGAVAAAAVTAAAA